MNANINAIVMQETDTKSESSQTLLDFYQHHLLQMDRLIRVNSLLKKENRLLRAKLKMNSSTVENDQKPKIVCKQY